MIHCPGHGEEVKAFYWGWGGGGWGLNIAIWPLTHIFYMYFNLGQLLCVIQFELQLENCMVYCLL